MIALQRPLLTPDDLRRIEIVLGEPVRVIPTFPAYAAAASGRVACRRPGYPAWSRPRVFGAVAPDRHVRVADETGRARRLPLSRLAALAWPELALPPAPHHRAKHTPERVAELRGLLADGMPLATAARLLGIPRTTARQMAGNRTWKGVFPLPA